MSTSAEADTVRGHLRDALQALHRLELYEVAAQGSDLTRAREEVTAAVAIAEQVHHEATTHPFSFARHVAEVV